MAPVATATASPVTPLLQHVTERSRPFDDMWSNARAAWDDAATLTDPWFKHAVILETMRSTVTKEGIEARIISLLDEFMVIPADSDLRGTSHQLFDAVCRQGRDSSRGGKRLRAFLALTAWQAAHPGDDMDVRSPETTSGHHVNDAMVDLACAIEVFQTGALVHDDIIDESDLRRGRPSAHRALTTLVDSASIGRGLGLMLGDILATCSIDIVNEVAPVLANPTAVMHAFLTMQRNVEIGQVLDLAVELSPLDEPGRLIDASLKVFRWKTSSYTTIAPIQLALLASGMSAGMALQCAESIGLPLGIAFQLGDDLLDVIGSSEDTGKPVGGDIREGKRTVLLADALESAQSRDRKELIDIFSSPHRDEEAVQRAIMLFHATGSIEHSRRRITDLWKKTKAAIGDAPLDERGRSILERSCASFIACPATRDVDITDSNTPATGDDTIQP